jgi:GNAT superfamily N-acetyltransferase
VNVNVVEEPITALAEHARISIAFTVESVLDCAGSMPDLPSSERPVIPYRKDYDAIEHPLTWASKFNISKWGLLAATIGAERVAGAVLAFDSPTLEMLENRTDIAALWDLRVRSDMRRRGVGAALFRAAEDWAARRGCRELKVETQNTNVPACRFYERQGCELRHVVPGAYPALPKEVQLIWVKALRSTTRFMSTVRIPTDPLPSCRPPLNQGSKRSIRGARGVFTWMLQRLADAALVNGQTVGIDEKAEGADPRDARALTSARNLGRMNS